MDKASLRRSMRERERALDADYIAYSDAAIFESVIALKEYASARTLFTYFSMGREPDTRRLVRRALEDGKTVCIPRVLGNGLMSAVRVKDEGGLITGAFGLLEPAAEAEEIKADAVELVIVPAAAYDRRGYRLGRGGGYYDRFLRKTEAFTVGLSRESLTLDAVPVEQHDIPVRCLVTEKGAARLG